MFNDAEGTYEFFKKLKESISSKTENVTKQFRDGLEKTRKVH
ncbi:UDP-3-O-[3-hydroxymyristoyl] N-acetylglucosamine deacetylase [Paenibacillus sp. JCM 10914]|nr:UDP-3-O-[3-hydroxymyristoyl] N-acetylglucosamine deacetylase [Paenibacillus sp. JCM 10914]